MTHKEAISLALFMYSPHEKSDQYQKSWQGNTNLCFLCIVALYVTVNNAYGDSVTGNIECRFLHKVPNIFVQF